MAGTYEFLKVFPCCAGMAGNCGGLEQAYLNAVLVDRDALSMQVDAHFCVMPAPAELRQIEERLRTEYGLQSVEVRATYPLPEAA